VSVPWSTCLTKVKSIPTFGARFGSSGFNGRVCAPAAVLQDLTAQLAFAPRLSSLRVFTDKVRSLTKHLSAGAPVSHACVTLRRASEEGVLGFAEVCLDVLRCA
jgi:hypothetical protein